MGSHVPKKPATGNPAGYHRGQLLAEIPLLNRIQDPNRDVGMRDSHGVLLFFGFPFGRCPKLDTEPETQTPPGRSFRGQNDRPAEARRGGLRDEDGTHPIRKVVSHPLGSTCI